MKGDFIIKILEAIGDLTVNTTDLLGAFLSSGYGASSGKLDYEISKRQSERAAANFQRRIKQDYYSLIYRLKKDGLIKEEIKNNKKFFGITRNGRKKLIWLKKRKKKELPKNAYCKEAGDKFIIVIFDIPEKEKRKREWLRAVLIRLELKMLQKSVWAGKIKLPKEFLDDLLKIKIIDYVEIFEISKTGSLKHLV